MDGARPAAGAVRHAPPPEAARVQRRTMTVLTVMQAIGTVGVGIAPSIGVLLAGEVTGSDAWAGLARTASILGAALLGLPLGNLAARYGRRAALTAGWWTAAVGSALLVAAAQADLVVPLFLGLLSIGAGTAVSLQARFAATDLAAPQHAGRSLAQVVWAGTIGSVLGPSLGAPGRFVGDLVGLNVYAGAFLIATVCLAVAGLIVFAWLRPDPLRLRERYAAPTPAPPGKASGRIRPMLAELGGNPAARFAVIAILTAHGVMLGVMTATPVHLAHHGGSITMIGITISLHVLGMFAFSPVVGHLADRLGPRRTIAAGTWILVASLVIGAIRPADTAWIVVSLFLLGLGWSFVTVAASAEFGSAVSGETRASAQGGVDALSNLCGAVAALAAGPALSVTGFSGLSVLAIAALVPLLILTARKRARGSG
ncbi:MFS transporter [Thermobispora bispora]|uniref:MFS transporter n=1 Tax=Thermobispora bispora TaxID=2006 RepID=UPI00197DFEC5|nr:MFS transporter [Thermobispora bispora]QSI49403.1 MFS transporter [Thermobispora bispora]